MGRYLSLILSMQLSTMDTPNRFPKRNSFLLSTHSFFLLVASLFLASFSSGQSDKQEKPNFIIIFVDDQGYKISAVGASDIETPRIDRMAKEGMLFTDFCGQTRADPHGPL